MDQILSWQEAYNAAKYFDKHLLTLTSQDLDEDKNVKIAAPADLDDKMGRIQFLFDKVMDKENLMTLLVTADSPPIDQFYAIGDKNLDGSLSKDEFQEVAKKLGYFDIINMYWAYMDANNDGLVTKAEMIAFVESTYQQNALLSTYNTTRKEI